MDSPIIIIWASPLSFLGGIRSIFFFLLFIQFTDENSLSKQYSPRWDATLCGVTSGAMLFAYVNLFSLLLFIFQDDTGFDMDMSHDEPDGGLLLLSLVLKNKKILYLETVRTRYIRDHDRYNINKKR